jgi:glutamate N-acetyltransferase/amino-acid N-acetyltransferase
MNVKIREIKQGTVTSPSGFMAGAVEGYIKYKGKLDFGILFSEKACSSAALFTANKIKAAPIIVSMRHIQSDTARIVVVNSGCANACTGKHGIRDAEETAHVVAEKLGVLESEILVASTGVIGTRMPMAKVKSAIQAIKLKKNGGHQLARAIMTTDTRPKEIAVQISDGSGAYIIGGIAKGSGMIHPDMATLLCFITTDAAVEPGFLHLALKKAVADSFNMITVDGDTSTNDMVSIMANGVAANKRIDSKNGQTFQIALNQVCRYLARCIAADGEGATKMIQVDIEGAGSIADARTIARMIAGSLLVKSAMHGNDPNWGRIVAALGRSGARIKEKNLDVYLQNTAVMQKGAPFNMDKNMLSGKLATDKVLIRICLNIGRAKATAWGCDLSEEYVTINSDYTS